MSMVKYRFVIENNVSDSKGWELLFVDYLNYIPGKLISECFKNVLVYFQGGGVFQGFSGFAGLNNNNSSFPASTFSIKPFAGNSTFTPGSANMFSGLNTCTAEASTSATASFTSLSSNENGFKANSSSDSKATNASGSSYKDNLKALNESVAAWIQKHIAVNPYVDLTPIFNDYKEHMKNIDLKFSSSTKERENSSSTSEALNTPKQPAVSSVSVFSAPSQASQETEESRSNKLNAGESLPSCKCQSMCQEKARNYGETVGFDNECCCIARLSLNKMSAVIGRFLVTCS